MPDTYTETASWVTPVTGPANTELVDAETSVTTPCQALTSRTAYLYAIIAPGTGTGVTRVREVATTALMKALNGNTNGDLVYVNSGTGQGLYRFVGETAVGVDTSWRIYACTGTGTAGNFRVIYQQALDVANGVAGLNASGKVPASEIANSVVALADDVYANATQFTTSSTTFVDAISGSNHPKITLSVNAGDVLDIGAGFNWQITGGGTGQWQVVVNDGTDVVPTALQQTASGSYAEPTISTAVLIHRRARYVVVNTGTLTIRLQHKVSAGGTTSTITEPVALFVVQYRP